MWFSKNTPKFSCLNNSIGKVSKSIIINIDFESWKLLYPHRKRLLGKSTKQPLSYFEPWILENISNFKGGGLTPVVYKCISVSLKNLHVPLKDFHKMLINAFATHTDNTQIKVIDSSSSRNKLYSTFVGNSKTSNLAHISDRHKIKSAS